MEIHCSSSNPVMWNGQPPTNNQIWNFQILDCLMPDFSTSSTSTLPEYISKIISSSTPEKNFYLSNTIDYGQVLILGFFILAFLFAVVFSVKNLVFKK